MKSKTWSLYEKEKFLEPLVFSNKKTQEDIVHEVLDEIKKGKKVIFVHGACGTGKSAIALNIAKELGKTSVVVPGKNLQRQYKKDYAGDKYVLKNNKEKLKISVITGRNNHECTFLKDNQSAIPVIKKEINSKLHDIFAGKREEIENEIKQDESADNRNIPCKIDIKEKNWEKIKKYLMKNDLVDGSKINEIKDVRRASVASLCPYWSPVYQSEFELNSKIFKNAKKRKYMGLEGNEFTIYQRKRGCPFYEQFNSFVDAEVIVFNSQKYKLETVMNRKPLTEVEIIDECDEFLDSFSNLKTINLERMQNSLLQLAREAEGFNSDLREMFEIIKHLKDNPRIGDSINSGDIIPLKETGLYDLFRLFWKESDFLKEIDDESYLYHVDETAKTFKEMIDETYVIASKRENGLFFDILSVNLAKRFSELVNKNKVLVLMSGTIHSEKILQEIFGIENFSILTAEDKWQGEIKIKRTGRERDFKYSNFSSGQNSREDYLRALDNCIELAKRPTLVHVNAFTDIPSERELLEYGLKNLISREKLQENQDKHGTDVREFKKGKREILFSTRVSRGIDFPGEECRSIIFTKYPNPNVQDPFWKILYKTRPNHYWDFYKDKARRELVQKVYRGLRFEGDNVEVWSPDTRVLEFFGERE